MAKVLSGYSGLGSQESTGVFIDSGGSLTGIKGAKPMDGAALKSNDDVDPQGVEFEIAVRLSDQSVEANREHFEFMVVSYDFDGSTYRWNKIRTIDSSNNGAAIDWSLLGSGANYLRFTAITSHEQFNRVESWRLVGDTGNPAFENSWINYGGSYHSARFRKSIDGQVHLQGLVKDGTIGQAIFTLPEEYRPAGNLIFGVGCNGGYARLNVNTTGEVTASSPTTNGWVTLMVSFFTD